MRTPLQPDQRWNVAIAGLTTDRTRELLRHAGGVKPTVNGRYCHWDSLRHRDPPTGLSHEEWWILIKMARSQLAQPLPLRDTGGEPFTIGLPGTALQMLRRIDRDASGQIQMSEAVTNPSTRNRYLVSSLIEEAIASSQLEGANTSRRVAKQMLRTGRSPRTKSEQMILNNFRAMNYVRDRASDPLTPDFVLELHELVTRETLGDPADAGRLQQAEDTRVRVWDDHGNALHVPPPAEQLPQRLQTMCRFANAESTGDEFLHPVARSVVLHFWLGHDHPFADGNGRTARALFYWSMLHHGYWLTEFLTISTIIKRGQARYNRAFLYSERDDNDLTYFLLHQLDVVGRAIDGLQDYLARKMQEISRVESLLRTTTLNHRQIALLQHALRTPGATYTFRGHARSHDVVYQTARTDLLGLEERGLLDKRRVGRAFTFYPASDLAEQLDE